VHPYKHTQQVAAARELDNVAARLAQQMKGRVSSRRTLEVAGLDARSYVIVHDALAEEITFVLRGKDEYELLCRRAQGGDDAACRRLVSSFRTTAGAAVA
jgi:glucokinase